MDTVKQSEEAKISRIKAEKSGTEIISVRTTPETQERLSMLMVGIIIAVAVLLVVFLLLYIIFATA